MTIKLFEGQTNHPLSPEELKEFRSRSTVFIKGVDKEEQIKIFNRILNDANQSPTARSIIRQALQANESFHYDFRKNIAKRDEKGNPKSGLMGGYNSVLFRDKIVLDKVLVNSTKRQDRIESVSTFVHETFHDLQNVDSFLTDKYLMDAETQAISSQITYEFDKKDKNYGLHYTQNYKKWLDYAKTGKIPADAPKNFLQFKPIQGLSPKELKEAQKQFAAQMASQETQAKFISDYISIPLSSEKEVTNIKPHQFIKRAAEEGLKYRLSQILSYLGKNQEQETDESLIQEIIDRNPFLKQENFNKLRKENGLPLKENEPDTKTNTLSNLGNTLKNNAQNDLTNPPADEATPINKSNTGRMA